MCVAQVDVRFDPTVYLAAGLSSLLAVDNSRWLVLHGAMTFGQLTGFIMYLGLIIWPMLALTWVFNIIERGLKAHLPDIGIGARSRGWRVISSQGVMLSVAISAFLYPPHAKEFASQDIYLTLAP